MFKIVWYALTAICLAASVGCLALWGWSIAFPDRFVRLSYFSSAGYVTAAASQLGVHSGEAFLTVRDVGTRWVNSRGWWYQTGSLSNAATRIEPVVAERRVFRSEGGTYYFPLWYPALVFAIAAVATIRVGRQFTLRSALVGMSVVAALLGIAVAL